MASNRTLQRSWRQPAALGTLALAALLACPLGAVAQDGNVQRAFDAGRFDEALEAAGAHRDDAATTFVAAQAAMRKRDGDRAREELSRLESNSDGSWKLTARSALALLSGNTDEARNLANEAVGANGDDAYAHYQLGLVLTEQGDHGGAANAFDRATQIKDDFAYAHYYAGLEFQRNKENARSADHLRRFLSLAPDAPERAAVATLLRTMRG